MRVDLSDRVAIITGAAGGIGSAMARMFARSGAAVVVCDLNEEGAIEVAAGIREEGGKALCVKANVGDREEARAMADTVVRELGTIDILVNNAGINVAMRDRGPIHEFPDEMWERIINVDLDGVFYCSKAVLRTMTRNRCGRIINIGSVVGAVPLRNQCAFAAAKAGVINLTKAMAIEVAEYGINVNVILPGSIGTPAMHTSGMYADGRYESIMSHIPLKRPGTPEDIGYGALYLASDAAGYVTGSVLTIDGGWTCGFARDW